MTEKRVPVEISARHIHLTAAALACLFGEGYALTPKRELSQPGQFLAEERLRIEGPKGAFDSVAVLGPARAFTQVELALTDGHHLGLTLPVRASGDIAGSAAVRLVGPKGALSLTEGAIAPMRHVHLFPDSAKRFGLEDGRKIAVRIDGVRALVFENVLVRVSPDYQDTMHIDTDEANAAGLTGPGEAVLLL